MTDAEIESFFGELHADLMAARQSSLDMEEMARFLTKIRKVVSPAIYQTFIDALNVAFMNGAVYAATTLFDITSSDGETIQ